MLKASKPLTAEGLGAYMREEYAAKESRYFSENQKVVGEWHGILAWQLGLEGAVEPKQFELMAAGKHPWSGEQLIKHRKQKVEMPKWVEGDRADWVDHVKELFIHAEYESGRTVNQGRYATPFDLFEEKLAAAIEAREGDRAHPALPHPTKEGKKPVEHIAGWDLTFAPNKTFSIMAFVAGDMRILEWHNEAVREALNAGQLYIQARLGGNNAPETTFNWAVAIFQHDTARPVDGQAPAPHLHSHCVLFNMTQANDKIRSVQAHMMFKTQSFMSAIYQARMARRAIEGGYEIEPGRNIETGKKNHSVAIKGLSQEYVVAMSPRAKEIEAEKEKQGLAGAEADERINKRLRQAKQEWDKDLLREHYRTVAETMGQDVDTIRAHTETQQWTPSPPEEVKRRAQQAITYARDRMEEQTAAAPDYHILRDALRHPDGVGTLDIHLVAGALKERVDAGRDLVKVEHVRPSEPWQRYTTAAMIKTEERIIDMALALRDKAPAIAPELTRDEFKAKYQTREIAGKVITATNDQLWAGYRTLTGSDQYRLIHGAAGGGKSTVLRFIAEVAEASGYEVKGLAPTTTAANNLVEEGLDAQTVQMHNTRGQIARDAPKRLYLFDEGSLTTNRQLFRFMQTVRQQDKVLIAYDSRQHQGVEAGRPVEMLQQAGVRFSKLEEVIRQREDPLLMQVMDAFKKKDGVKAVELLDSDPYRVNIHQVPDRQARLRYMAQYSLRYDDVIMTAPDNRTIRDLNGYTRVAMREQGRLGADVWDGGVLTAVRDVAGIDRRYAANYEIGNVLRWSKNVKSLGVDKGMYTAVTAVDAAKNQLTIEYTREGEKQSVTYSPHDAYGVEIFEAARRSFAVGEKIQLTRPWRLSPTEQIANRSQAVILSIKDDGDARIRFKDGETMDWNPRKMPHVEYAYAMTSYAVQFATADNTIAHIDCGDTRVREIMNQAYAYVALSRGAKRMEIFTDDTETLKSEHSPIARIAEKPKAMSHREIQDYGHSVA